MMKRLYLASTAVFWIAVLALWGAAAWLPGTAPSAASASGRTLADVARHNKPTDCWMAIHGQVYDFTSYLPQHPSAPEAITPSCGTDATNAFDTKNAGRPHSPYANGLLKKYLLGPLAK